MSAALVLLFMVLAWESLKLIVSLRQQASVWAGQKYERERSPRAFWILIGIHSLLLLIVALEAATLLFGWLK